MKVSKTHPNWKAYVDFVNGIVVDGLAKSIASSLEYLVDNINPDNSAKPMLTIQLDLTAQVSRFIPDVGPHVPEYSGLKGLVQGWVDAFYQMSTILRRIDDGEGSYVKEMVDDLNIRRLLALVHARMEEEERLLLEYKGKFDAYSHLWTDDMRSTFNNFLKTAYLEYVVDEKKTLKLKEEVVKEEEENDEAKEEGEDDHETVNVKLPNLKKFDEAISHYRHLRHEVDQLKSPARVGWVLVDSDPMKDALGTWLAKYANMYTQYLSNYVVDTLKEVEHFMVDVDSGLQVTVEEGEAGKENLKKCMGYIRDVKRREKTHTQQALFGPLHTTISTLKKHGVAVDAKIGEPPMPVVEYLDNLPMRWHATHSKTMSKMEEILPLQQQEAESIKAEQEATFQAMRSFRHDFRANAPFTYDGKPDGAYKIMDNYIKQLKEMAQRATELNHMEELFELKVTQYPELNNTRQELQLLKMLWDFKGMVESTYDDWKSALWTELDTESMESENKNLQQAIKKMGDSNANMKGWQVYRDIVSLVDNMN
ncbi:ODA4, partial [Symbiodinium sp. KB8]